MGWGAERGGAKASPLLICVLRDWLLIEKCTSSCVDELICDLVTRQWIQGVILLAHSRPFSLAVYLIYWARMRKIIGNHLVFLAIFMIAVCWVYSGWPNIAGFPPRPMETSAALTNPGMPILYGDDGGTNQIAFRHSRQSDTTPIVRASATSTASFNLFQVEFNTASDFSGTAYTQTFSGTYASGVAYNLQTTATLGLPSTDGVTYYVRVRASPDAGSNYGEWSPSGWSYTHKSSGDVDWYQTTSGQFTADTLYHTQTTGTGSVQLMKSTNQFFTDFSEYTTGSLPSDWSRRWASDGTDWIVRDDATATGGKVLRAEGDGVSRRRMASWDALGTSYADMELYEVFSLSATNRDGTVAGRCSGTGGSETGYRVGYNLTTYGNEIARYSSGSFSRISYSAYTPSVDTWYKSRVLISGSNLKIRTWLATDSEPSTWNVETTNSNITAAGWIGLFFFTSTSGGGTKFDVFSVGVNGASAPASQVSFATGTIMSPEIDFDSVPSSPGWDSVSFSTTETNGDVKVRLYYTSSNPCDTIVPDGALSGNSSGFDVSASPIDISGLNTTTYNQICLQASLTDSGGTPYINDWTVAWQTPVVGQLSVDIVDGSGSSVASPSVSMNPVPASMVFQVATGTLGVSTEKIRVENGTASPTWTMTIAANSATAFWDGVSSDYDFNDPTAGAGDGGDADSLGGQMTVDPSVATVTPQSGCSTTGLTLGGSASFSQGVTDAITLLSAGSGAGTSCYWDVTGIDISQTIPASQQTGSYSIDLVIDVTAI